MSITNFKLQTELLIELELESWANGEKSFNMGNQLDESILESAMENIDNMPNNKWEWFMNASCSLMTIAHELSKFETPEISEAWYN